MADTMQAVVNHGMNDFRLDEVFDPRAVDVPAEIQKLTSSIIGEEKELDVLGAHLAARMYPSAIASTAEGSVKMDGVVTDRVPLPHYAEAFAKMEGGSGSIKTTLAP